MASHLRISLSDRSVTYFRQHPKAVSFHIHPILHNNPKTRLDKRTMDNYRQLQNEECKKILRHSFPCQLMHALSHLTYRNHSDGKKIKY